MDKEQLNSKLKEMAKQADVHSKKTKEKLNEVCSKENVKENLKKAKNGIDKVIDNTKNSSIIKRMTTGQKLTVLGVTAVVLIAIIALIGRFIFSPDPSIWCVADAPKTELAFNSAGEVTEVACSEKQVVSKGETIARVKEEVYITNLENAEAKSKEANWKYFKMKNRHADIENKIAESMLKSAENQNEAATAAFELAGEYEKQYRSYFENGEISKVHYETSVREVATAETELKRAQSELEKAKQYLETVKIEFTPEEIELAKQEADAATEHAAKAKATFEGASIKAPFNAYINRINVNVGDTVEPGKPVFEVIDLSKIWLRGLVNKAMTESLKPGAAVNIEFPEIPNETFTGKITQIASQSVQTDKGKDMYELSIELDNSGNYILPGMEAIAIAVSY